MSDWLSVLAHQWASSNWEPALSHFLKLNPSSSPKHIPPLFEQLQQWPGFLERGQALLSVLLLSGDLKSTLSQLQDFCCAFEKSQKTPFDFSTPHIPAFLTIFAGSDFLTRRLLKEPSLATAILASPFLEQSKPLQTMVTELRQRLHKKGNIDKATIKKELRLYKYEEYLRITMRDLGELGAFTEILAELSSVATACVQIALEAAHSIAQGMEAFHIDETSQFQQKLPLIILGLGKLGGNELNYSSDIDPIFICNADPAQYPPPFVTNKILVKTARGLIELIGENTEEGFVVRVDMRLRPGGETAPLFQSLEATERYYETQGDTWERQALIKARPIAGNLAEGAMFLKNLTPLIYNKHIDENMLQEIQNIKQRIEKEHLKQHLNVKLGVGGIREIEFFVQIYQLLYGGAEPALRQQNTLSTIEILAEKQHITPSDAQALRQSYLYLRKLEHRLQMEQELQTHVVPGISEKQQRLARQMGYHEEDIEQACRHFLQDLRNVMTRVRSLFSSLFDQEHLEIEASIRNQLHFHFIPEDVQTLIKASARQFLAVIRQADQSKLGLRFQQLFEKIQARLDYYQYLLDHPAALQRLSRIAETSEFLWNYLLNHLELLKELDAAETLHTKEDWEQQLSHKLATCEDEEQQLDALREFKHAVTLFIGSAELEGILPYEQARKRLTLLAEVVLQATYQIVRQKMATRFGEPCCEGKPAHLAILGLGKLGGHELTYHSDLDLIFICSDAGTTSGPQQISNYEYYAKLVQRLNSALYSFTRLGYAYQMDTRLRPSGKGGPLVNTLAFYQVYHQTSLPWEQQSLTKARVVGGDLESAWIKTVEETITQILYETVLPDDLKQQIFHLRQRKEKEIAQETEQQKNIKEGYGGLLDIEYLTQYLQMQHGKADPKLRSPRTLDTLRHFEEQGVLNRETIQTLRQAFIFYRLLESYLRLLCDTDTNTIDFSHLQTDKLITFLHYHGYSVSDVFETYQQTTQTVRQIYQTIMQTDG